MPISRHEDWVRIAELDDQDQIRFTPAFQAVMGDLGWEAKAFIGKKWKGHSPMSH
jgi:hypothetical protein